MTDATNGQRPEQPGSCTAATRSSPPTSQADRRAALRNTDALLYRDGLPNALDVVPSGVPI